MTDTADETAAGKGVVPSRFPQINPGRRALLATAAVALGGFARLTPARSAGKKDSIVSTREGTLQGIETENLTIFKGIRYGEDTGSYRFRPPVPVRPWVGIRQATTLGAPCPQDNPDPAPWCDPMPPSEDCLFLNVWAPKNAEKRPVMVWLHGGGFWWGSGGAPIYDGSAIATKGDVVVVTVNHRLNVFGYLYLGDVSSQVNNAGNPGNLDLVEALRWVRRNIEAFGGDPENITLFGESGGGMKVLTLLGMPSAKGLFQKAIIQSGAVSHLNSPEQAVHHRTALLHKLGLKPESVGTLKDMPAADLVSAYASVLAEGSFWSTAGKPYTPVLDPATLPFNPHDARALALSRQVPLLMGNTHDESVWLLSLGGQAPPSPADDAGVAEKLRSYFPALTPKGAEALVRAYRAKMPAVDEQALLVAITTSLWMGRNTRKQAEVMAQPGRAPIYMYIFDWREPILGGRWAIHGCDVGFVFDKLDLKSMIFDGDDAPGNRAKVDPRGDSYKLRDAVMAAWTHFAHHGTPETRLLPKWPVFRRVDRPTMVLAARSHVVDDPTGPQIRALENTLPF